MDLISVRNQLNKGENIYSIPLRVVYYARVSTDNDEQLHSLSAQIQYYEGFIKNIPAWSLIDRYIDEGLSGSSVHKRKSFLKMIDDARQDKFDFIITKEISRFSRNTLDSIKYTQQLLSDGVGVFFQTDNINTLLPDSELRLTIMASIAQEEVRKLSERVKFGINQSTKSGIVWGTNNIWGYTKDSGKLVVHEEEAKIVRLIFDMYATQGLGFRRICTALAERGHFNRLGNVFDPRSIRGILTNPKYKGYYCGNKSQKYDFKSNRRKILNSQDWLLYKDEDNIPPIVSEEIWDKANAILHARGRESLQQGTSPCRNKYAYSSKIICMTHNDFFYRREVHYPSGSKEFWKCKKSLSFGKDACTAPIIYTSDLDSIIKKICSLLITDKPEITKELAEIYTHILDSSTFESDLAKLQAEIAKIQYKKEKLLELSIDESIPNSEFKTRNDGFNTEIEKLKEKIEHQTEKTYRIRGNIKSLENIIVNKLNFDTGFTPGFINGIIDKIEVHHTAVQPRLKIYLKFFQEALEYHIPI